MKALLDPYSLKARVAPAFLVILPVAIAIGVWIQKIEFPTVALFGLSANVVISCFVAERVRDQGKQKELALWKSWGGAPTTQLLRHRNPELSREIRSSWHQSIQTITGSSLPSLIRESNFPNEADAVYEAAVYRLREKTRDADKYPLVLKENISYGFRRNLWAMKPLGIALAAIGSLGCLVRFAADLYSDLGFVPTTGGGLAVCVFIFVSWIFGVTPDWVRKAAFEYAKRLLGASILLADSIPPKP